jgi:hypothetical protein
MKKFISAIAYIIAFLMLIVVLATFMGMNFWAAKLVAITKVKISPRFTGGEVRETIDHGTYQTLIHQPVFDGLLGPTSKGFVQVVWKSELPLPKAIEEAVDYDHDGKADFLVKINTETLEARFDPYGNQVTGLEGSYKLKKGAAIRVELANH